MKPKLSDLIAAFSRSDATDSDWEEYGRSDEDDAKGIIAVLKELGIEYEDDAVYDCGQLSSVEEIERKRKFNEEYFKKHPRPNIEAFNETLSALTKDTAIRDRIIETLFASSSVFNAIRGKKPESE
jgi:hypothetical protein